MGCSWEFPRPPMVLDSLPDFSQNLTTLRTLLDLLHAVVIHKALIIIITTSCPFNPTTPPGTHGPAITLTMIFQPPETLGYIPDMRVPLRLPYDPFNYPVLP